jgi:hypothetical protein
LGADTPRLGEYLSFIVIILLFPTLLHFLLVESQNK